LGAVCKSTESLFVAPSTIVETYGCACLLQDSKSPTQGAERAFFDLLHEVRTCLLAFPLGAHRQPADFDWAAAIK
jgi:hypothetical protein